METSLHLYKRKLRDAIKLVFEMNMEKKAEAVAYWNNLAEELQEIVQVDGTSYRQQMVDISETSTVPNSLGVEPVYKDIRPTQRLTSLETEAEPISTSRQMFMASGQKSNPAIQYNCESAYPDHEQVTSSDKTTVPIQNVTVDATPSSYPNNETIVICGNNNVDSPEYMSVARNVESRSVNQLQQINCQYQLDGRLDVQTEMNANQSQVEFAQPGMNSNNYSSNIISSGLGSGIVYPQQDTMAPNIVCKMRSDTVNLLGTNGDAVVDSSFSKGTTTVLAPDIGNGQFDRGPKNHNQPVEYTTDHQLKTSSSMLSPSVDSGLSAQRIEPYTLSDKPLQQIQPFHQNTSFYKDSGNNQSTCEEFESSRQQIRSPTFPKVLFKDLQISSLGKSRTLEHSADCLESDQLKTTSAAHTCEVCGKSGFSTKGNLKRHLRAHSGEKPFRCEYCKSCFTEKKSLKIHVRRHTGEKPYKCEICGKMFSQTGVLQSHMALHLDERKFDCHKCGKAFRQRSQLKIHLMRHEGVKRLECSTCNAKFLTKGDLERHCRIHTGERPYACEICNKTFTRQQSLNEHVNRHIGRRPYDCKYCDKTFSEMSACYKHAKTHKAEELSTETQSASHSTPIK